MMLHDTTNSLNKKEGWLSFMIGLVQLKEQVG